MRSRRHRDKTVSEKKVEQQEAFERARPEIEKLLRAGATHAEVRLRFAETVSPGILGSFVHLLRRQGVLIKPGLSNRQRKRMARAGRVFEPRRASSSKPEVSTNAQ